MVLSSLTSTCFSNIPSSGPDNLHILFKVSTNSCRSIPSSSFPRVSMRNKNFMSWPTCEYVAAFSLHRSWSSLSNFSSFESFRTDPGGFARLRAGIYYHKFALQDRQHCAYLRIPHITSYSTISHYIMISHIIPYIIYHKMYLSWELIANPNIG